MSDVRVFNDQLLLVLRAGVPLAIGNLTTVSQIEKFVNDVNNRVSSVAQVAVGMDERLAADEHWPADYRSAFDAWKRGDRTAQAMQALFETGSVASEMRWSITKLLLPLILVMGLVAQGMALLVGRIYPELKSMVEISNRKTSTSLQFLEFLNANAMAGTIGLVVSMVLIALLWLRVPAWLVRLVPAYGLTIQSLRTAQQYERDARHSTASTSNPDLRSSELRGAICRGTFVFTSHQWLRWFPMIAGTLVCGLLVFGYVFCLFWPLVDLLQQLSLP